MKTETKAAIATLAIAAALVFRLVVLAQAAQSFTSVQELTVLISSEDFGGAGRGTGILIDPMHVITCAHVVEGAGKGDPELLVYTYPLGAVYTATVVAVDGPDDLALIVLDSSAPFTAAPVFQESVEVGEPVVAIGNALGGMKWMITHGIVSAMTGRYLLTDAPINPGNSGGPIVNAKGEVLGITDWRIGPAEGVPGFAGGVPSSTINRVIQAYNRRNDMSEILKAILGGN